MAQNVFAPLEGNKVRISDLSGTFKSCSKCGGQDATVSVSPVDLHAGHLQCDGCGAITSWLGRDHLSAMLAQHKGAA